eukprot:2464717-Rhodomonas_salina.1
MSSPPAQMVTLNSPPPRVLAVLNDEIFGHVFEHMSWGDVMRWRSVSKRLQRMVENLDEGNLTLQVLPSCGGTVDIRY